MGNQILLFKLLLILPDYDLAEYLFRCSLIIGSFLDSDVKRPSSESLGLLPLLRSRFSLLWPCDSEVSLDTVDFKLVRMRFSRFFLYSVLPVLLISLFIGALSSFMRVDVIYFAVFFF